MQALNGSEPAIIQRPDGKEELLSGEALLTAYKEKRLDQFSITPSQLLELLAAKKQDYIKRLKGKSCYGLDPTIEEEYAKQINKLKGNERPLLENIDSKRRKTFRLAVEVAVLPDLVEMVLPPVESILRTLYTKHSQDRPFFRLEDRQRLLKRITDEPGNISLEGDSDARRVWWELLHIEHIPGSVMAEDPYVREKDAEVSLMGALAWGLIGEHIMRGDITDIDENYSRRVIDISKKGLRKAGFSKIRQVLTIARLGNKDDFVTQLSDILRNNDLSLAERYREKAQQLYFECQILKDMIANKPDGNGSVKVYSEGEIQQFIAMNNEVIGILCKKYSISSRQLRKYKQKLTTGAYTSRYRSYDSLGGIPRTLVEPIAEFPLQTEML
jgi:hypothetical protein